MGGVIPKSNDEAFYPRNAQFFVDVFSFWDSAVDQESNIHWNRKVYDRILKVDSSIAYVGFPQNRLKVEDYYGPHTQKLQEVKEKVDPLNILKFPGSL